MAAAYVSTPAWRCSLSREMASGVAPCVSLRSALPLPAASTRPSSHIMRAVKNDTATIEVHFQAADVTVTAKAGDNIYDLAERAGVDTIQVGCCTGNCGVCEVEVRKMGPGESPEDAAAIVVRSCVTPLPPGYARIEINEMLDDVWGLDGFDT